jgi:hypothetical protein
MENVMLTLAAVLLATTVGAQTPDTIVGTWRLVSFLSPDASGQQRPVWGEHPAGLIIYTSDGHVSAQLYDPRRVPVGEIANAIPSAPAQGRYSGLYTYFGTFALDVGAHTVSHHVEGAMAPDWVGSTLVRGYRFLGPDRLELRVLTDAAGRTRENGSILVWERVRP